MSFSTAQKAPATPSLDVQVIARTHEAEGIVSLLLGPLPNATLPRFDAGAHVEVHIADGIVRPYSLANDPAEADRYLLGVLRDPASRGGSARLHDSVTAGSRIRIGAPRNLFALAEDARHSILLAGGIGLTPLLAMAHRLHALGRSFELHGCFRSAARVPFQQVLRRGPFAGAVHLHLDDGSPAQRLDLDAVLDARRDGAHAYVCGPNGFIDHVTAAATRLGWPGSAVHVERFDAEPQAAGGAFRVVIASTGVELEVPADRSLASVLIEHGVALSISCERGICGTCLTEVKEGIPDHRDLYQADDEKAANTHITPCCSRACSPRLVLNL